MAVLGLRFCARAFSSCGKWGPLFIAVCGPLTVAASLVAEHRLQTRRLSSCGSWAQLLCGMWDLPGPGLEPVSPALAGRFSTPAPPGKSWHLSFYLWSTHLFGHTCPSPTTPHSIHILLNNKLCDNFWHVPKVVINLALKTWINLRRLQLIIGNPYMACVWDRYIHSSI